MDGGVVEQILRAYGVSYRHILAPQKGYRNTSYGVLRDDQPPANLILYKNEPGILARIKNANKIGNFVAASGLPARQTISPRIIALQTGSVVKYGALYNYLPGSTIPWETYTMERIKELGKTMHHMHSALENYDATGLPDAATESLQLNKRMLRYFAGEHVSTALRAKLGLRVRRANFTELLGDVQKLPNQQALHMDFVRGNILFEGTKITGILDFEKAARGPALFDIARTLAFLLVDCKYKPEQKVRKYFLQSGYIKRGAAGFVFAHGAGTALSQETVRSAAGAAAPLQPGKGTPVFGRGPCQPHAQTLNELTNFFLLHDFYKFLRHNPYEALSQNEHFVRTKAMLLKRGLIAADSCKIK